MRKPVLIIVGLIGVAAVAAGASHNVPAKLTATDEAKTLSFVERRIEASPVRSFSDEVRLIRSVQDLVLDVAPRNEGIPHGQEREFPDLARLKYGLCYDRSRAIEVILRMKGFETRHASIYSLLEQTTALEALATPGTESHAVTEVKTSRGWMLVDSNQRWLGLSKNGRPLALSDLRQTLETKPTNVGRPMPPIYRGPFTWVYGLYSRHGQFYPPYTPVPDVNWSELTRNI